MANRRLSKEVLDSFLDNFTKDLKKSYGENITLDNVIYHLIDKGIAPTQRVRDYAIIHDFLDYKQTNTTITMKQWACMNEDIYTLDERKIRQKIKDHTLKYTCTKHVKNL